MPRPRFPIAPRLAKRFALFLHTRAGSPPLARTLAGSGLAVMLAAGGLSAQSGPVAGRNVNIVGGPTMFTFDPVFDLLGDPMRAQQNEPSCGVSTRHPLHILCGANDYRAVDLPGIDEDKVTGDAWSGVFQSRDGGLTWQSRLHPGFVLDPFDSVLKPFRAIADPMVRIGPAGLGFHSGIAFERGDKGQSVLFVSTWMDLLAREGDRFPFKHVRTALVDSGNVAQFIDKPWMALGSPRPGATCTLDVPVGDGTSIAQTVPSTPVYVAWATFVGHAGNDYTHIYFSRSVDCGATFSHPVKVSAGNFKNQGVQLAVLPRTNTLFIAWRRGATDSAGDAMMVATSTNGGASFSQAVAVAAGAPLTAAATFPGPGGQAFASAKPKAKGAKAPAPHPFCPFDQGTSAFTFRTVGFPTLAAGGGRAFLFWSQRQGSCSHGVTRVVVSSSADGVNWTPPAMVDNPPVPAHQIMPAAAVAGDRLQVVWLDFRSDASGLFGPFVEERSVIQGLSPPPPRRHTGDVNGAQAALGPNPAFTPYPVSQYIFGLPVLPVRQTEKVQLQHNPVNVRMFKKMSVPFVGDYLDVATTLFTPANPVQAPGAWVANTGQLGDTPALAAWTDNRNVKLFPEDYTVPRPYTRPDLPGLGATSIVDPAHVVAPCEPGLTGSKNQDVYAAPILPRGWFAAAAWNNKPLGFTAHPGPAQDLVLIQRAFAVFVRNVTAGPRQFKLTIANPPAGGSASFDQFDPPAGPPLTQIHITVPARSMVARSVFVTAPNPRAAVGVDVHEDGGPGHMRIWLNPDPSAPESLLLPESVPPNQPAFDISSFEVYDITIGSPSVKHVTLTPGLTDTGWPNPEWENPEWENPEWENPEWQNPEWQNPEWQNPEWQNPEWENPEWKNPEWENPEWENGSLDENDYRTKSLKQFRWKVTNAGNTTAAYSTKVVVLNPTGDFKFQLVVYKLYTTPATTGCEPNLVGHTQVLSNVTDLDVSVANFLNPDWENSSAALYWLEPGEEAFVTLRAVGTVSALATLDVNDVIAAAQPQAVNTADAQAGVTEPPVQVSAPAIVTESLPDGSAGVTYPTTTLQAVGGTPPYVWSVAGLLPPGLALGAATGEISGTPTAGGTFTFTAIVTDSGAQTAGRTYTVSIAPPVLLFVAQPVDSIGGQLISPPVQVQAQDGSGAAITGLTIDLALGNNPGNGALTGVTSAQTEPTGVATFDSLFVDRGSPGYTLAASAAGANTTSDAFHVVGFSFTTDLAGGRRFHTATRLLDGRVLVAGGRGPGGVVLDTAEIYDPTTGTFAATAGTLVNARQEHTATLLADGRVLLVGGFSGSGQIATAELFDPSDGTFTTTGSLAVGRSLHTATRLADGSVLIAGGISISGPVTNRAERYLPDSGTFATVGSMATARYEHRAVPLPSGLVLVLGGFNGVSAVASVELFDPNKDGGAFQAAGLLVTARHNHEAVLLPTGLVLVAGGVNKPSEGPASTLQSAELYDPIAFTSATTGPMTTPRQEFAAALLRDGTVLLAGGTSPPAGIPTDTAEVYDHAAGTFSPTGHLATRRARHRATLLDGGQVLVTGGDGASSSFLKSAEIYHPLPSGHASDPAGDTTDPGGNHDLTFARVVVTNSALEMSVRFAAGTFNQYATVVQFVLDTDQNAATGHRGSDAGCVGDNGIIGAEYIVNMGSDFHGASAVVHKFVGPECNAFDPGVTAGTVTYVADGIDVTIPLSLLGGDDGKLDYKVISFHFEGDGVFSVIHDRMPDVGLPPAIVP